ncbi:hypothetical protein PV327_010316 [Microctonus hyperodae]|uniref:RUN domain-containing protein n=1 Tax=Microctonus hyperodae TaxID=165561 RepID=A0AA39FRM2_MICHY|nr:hypothetical protein PV327_010316 [Microctonus hyperodae]
MALRIMSAIVPGTLNSSIDSHDELINHSSNREKLQECLLAASKLCHIRFGGRMELATDSDECVSKLCHALESILQHGLRSKSIDKINSALKHVSDLVSGSTSRNDTAFWPCIKEQLTWHEQERFSVLKNVHTEYGRGRAWLRAALNERSLERHLHSIINSRSLSLFYENWSFILDQEKSCVLPNIAAGLGTIVFAIRVDNNELDHYSDNDEMKKSRVSQSEPIISSIIVESSELNRDKIRKKIPTHIISFDNDENDNRGFEKGIITSISAPATCLNSPISILNKDSLNPHPSMFKSSQSSSSLISSDKSTLSQDNDNIKQMKSNNEERILTPLTDIGNMGGLVPVSPLDQTLDDMLVNLPNYIDDDTTTEITEDAIEATEPLSGLDCHEDADKLDIESLKIRILAMSEILEQSREDAVNSRLQLARFQRQHQNYLERHEVQLQALNRENELLRQQLRKYVTAVQMLKRDSDTGNLSDEEQQTNDYHNEAEQYQEKLIQVAEMHAELMEFNARLTMQLGNRDKLVKRLQAELECLRGPLSEEDTINVEPPCLIHIWIPSAFLTGQSSDIHHVYQV